jgi:MSHA pilin protein MshD
MSTPQRRQSGITLIELIMFIVIVSVGVAGILSVLNVTVQHSSDPLVQKQAQALAEGLLEEIQTGYFAYCDGADSQLRYANTATNCTGGIGEVYGNSAGKARPYDTVKSYASAANTATALASVLPNEASVSAPAGYSATVTSGPALLGKGDGANDISVASGDALLIAVTVSGPGTAKAVAEGFKSRQVPQ